YDIEVSLLDGRLHQFEDHGRAAKMRERIAVAYPGVHHRRRYRQLGFRFMMIGDYEIHSQFRRPLSGLQIGRAAVDGDYEVHLFGRQAFDRALTQAKAVVMTVRDMVYEVRMADFV